MNKFLTSLVLLSAMVFATTSMHGCKVTRNYDEPIKEQQYISDISDLPVHSDYIARNDLTTVFDTAEGRIVDVYLESRGFKPEDIEAQIEKTNDFYFEILPQLGWTPYHSFSPHPVYYRGDETLEFSTFPKNARVLVHFVLKPLTSK